MPGWTTALAGAGGVLAACLASTALSSTAFSASSLFQVAPLALFGAAAGVAAERFRADARRARRDAVEARLDSGTMLNSLGEGIITIDRDYRIVQANLAYCEMAGVGPSGEVVGRHCYEVSHRLDHPCHEEGEDCPVRKVFETGQPETCIHSHPADAGGVDRVALTGHPLKDGSGRVVKVMEIVRNLTQEVLAEQRLRESEERYRELYQHSYDAIFTHDMQGRIIDVNQKAIDLLGYTRGEIFNISVQDLHPGGASGQVMNAFSAIGKHGFISFEIDYRRKDGSVFPAEVSSSLLEVGGKSVVQSIVRDITARRAEEDIRKQYAEKLEEMNSLKDLFSDILCHDLLNPASIVTSVSALLAGRENPRDEKEITMIRRNAERIMRLIRDASTYARIEDESVLDREERDLVAIIASCLESLRPKAEERGITITFEHQGEVPVRANWMIVEVFENLISNAVKYSPESSEVTITVERQDDGTVVSVTDCGEGVPDAYKESIFERFRRGEESGVKGTGLGLAIARRVMNCYGGRVWVEDNPDGGSIFRAALPAK
jgi:PAS domain S-box-containing protein